MNRERWKRVEELLQGALDRSPAVRATYLDEASGGDGDLKSEVLELLRQHEKDAAFLDAPLVDLGEGAGAPQTAAVSRIGSYRIVREIGAGGMGVVYLAMHEGQGFERPVALKVIRRGMDTDDLLRRFQLERRILAALRHPNIAHFVDAGATEDGRPYFVMDFVEGVAINTYCERNALSVRRRLRLFIQVCAAVEHAHGNLIVHRDLKPGNILVAADGTPVLLDFGIGKLVDPQEASAHGSKTETGVRAFTPEYASPEQLRGEPVSTSTDVYGLGLLLYSLLTGRRPFGVSNGFEYEKAVLTQEPSRPSSFGDRELAGDLDTIVLKALRKEPERRYSSVAALSDDIQRYLDGLPVRARPDTFGYRTGKFVGRHRLPLAAATVVFAALVGATLYSRAQTRAVSLERDKAMEVQTFLMEMFGSTSAGRADSTSIRQLLDAQAAQIPIAYSGNPELRAQMLNIVADGYDRLGLFAKAESLATEALAERRSTLRPDHSDIATSASLLGWIKYERGNAKDGEALLREALARWPNARPANYVNQARTMNDLGVLTEAAGKYDSAAALYRDALVIRRRLFGDSNRSVAITASNLSVVLYRKGDLKTAVATAEQALAVMRRAAGPDHQRSTLIQGNLASMRAQLGDVAGAEAEYRDLLARQTRVSGRQHPVTANSQVGLAAMLRAQGKNAEAETNLVEALANLEKAFGPDHARVANALTALGGVRSAMGRTREARPLLERALAIQRKLHGETHRDVALAISSLGMLYGESGDWAGSERLHRQAVAVMERAQGPKHVETATLRARLARAVFVRGRPAEAYALYLQSHDAMVAAGVKPTSVNLRDAKLRIAESLLAQKRRAEADSVLRTVADSGATPAQRALRDTLRNRLGSGKGEGGN